jgi:hypothetical protein
MITDMKTVKSESTVAATIYEAGNGFPDTGDYVQGDDGNLYQVIELGPRIMTGSRSGESNHIPYCRVTLVRVVLGSDE